METGGCVTVTDDSLCDTTRGKNDLPPLPPQHASNKKENKSLRRQLEDVQYRSKLLYTFWVAGAFLSLGLACGQNGPTLLDLQIITDTNLEESAAFFTGIAIGYLIATVICGALLDKISSNVFLFIATFGIGVVSIATPYCSFYPAMILVRSGIGVCGGLVDTAGNTQHMRIWGNDGQVLMQLLHFCYALGGVLSPLYTEPFLAERTNETEHAMELQENFTISDELQENFTISDELHGNFTIFDGAELLNSRETNILYAFLITGICSFVISTPFLIKIWRGVGLSKKERNSKGHEKVRQRKLPKPLFVFVLASLCFFYVTYNCVEEAFASFLMTFLVNHFDFMTKSRAAYITAAFWASFAVSRFLMIFMSKLLTAVRLLYLCCTLMLIAYTGFLTSASLSAVGGLYVFAVMSGLSMSAVFPAGFSWTESELLKVTGRVSSCILVSASAGTMTYPLILGYLMEEVSNMWFCYLLMGMTVLMSIVFVFLVVFNRCYVNKHYGPVGSVFNENSVNVSTPEAEHPLRANTAEASEEMNAV